MLEFTDSQIKKYLLGVIAFTIIYLLIYNKKGINKSIGGYIDAIKSCMAYAISVIFIIVGAGLIKPIIIQNAYIGLVIPLVWFLIIYSIIRYCLKKDFGLELFKIKLNPQKKKLLMEILIRIVIAISFAFASVMIFIVAVPDLDNQPYGPIPLIIAGALFGIISIILIYSTYYRITTILNERKKHNEKI